MNKKLLVVVPYRDRLDHLNQFIPHISLKLQEQNIINQIVIVEQMNNDLFNRGLLCNIGYNEFGNKYDYVCFHDVDMLCETDYSYSEIPLSLLRKRTKIDKIFDEYFGGVTLFPNHIFEQINGFSNKYKGWGAEDDDLRLRCVSNSIQISYRNGFCDDLEFIEEDTNRKNNPHYKNNVNILLNFKLNMNNYLIQNDGVSSCKKLYKIHQIYTYATHIKLSVIFYE